MKQWMGTRRYVYNKVLSKIKGGIDKINFFDLRNKYVTAKDNPDIKDFELEVPKDIRAGSIRDIVKNYKTSFLLLKNRTISGFNMGYCLKKNNPSIEIPKSSIKLENNKLFIYKTYLPNNIRSGKDKMLKNISINHDCRLQLKNNQWYLIIPIDAEIKPVTSKKNWCSLDPGERTFQTVYSEEMILQIKVRKTLLKSLQHKIDNFKSLRDRNIISRSRFKRRERIVYRNIENLISDLHHKTANILTKTFNHIIIPIFESQKIVNKSNNKDLNRNLLCLQHYKFRERLTNKCQLRRCSIDVCTEEYTSQTCGCCGKLTKVGSKDIFKCNSCGQIIDRDLNGARNIAIKRLNEKQHHLIPSQLYEG